MQDAKETLRCAVSSILVDNPVVCDPESRTKILHGGVVLFGEKSDVGNVKDPLDFKNLKSEDLNKLVAITPKDPKKNVLKD